MHRKGWASHNAHFEKRYQSNHVLSFNFESHKFNLSFWNNQYFKINIFIDLYFHDYKAKILILQKLTIKSPLSKDGNFRINFPIKW